MSPIHFEAKLFTPKEPDRLGSGTLLTLPQDVSAQLPSRGMVMIKGTINGSHFQAPVEPDGKGSHWFKVDEKILRAAGAKAGDTVTLAIEPTKDWPEPKLPQDLQDALAADPEAHAVWVDITPMARWDWIRWIGAAKQMETRKRRVVVACSKLRSGKRRPCCFDRAQCTLTEA